MFSEREVEVALSLDPPPRREEGGDPEIAAVAQRRRFTPQYKLEVLREADRCRKPGEIGALLRREGLYGSHLVTWRAARAPLAPSPLISAPKGTKLPSVSSDRDPLVCTIPTIGPQNCA